MTPCQLHMAHFCIMAKILETAERIKWQHSRISNSSEVTITYQNSLGTTSSCPQRLHKMVEEIIVALPLREGAPYGNLRVDGFLVWGLGFKV